MSDEAQTNYVGVIAQDLVDTDPHALLIGEDSSYLVKHCELGLRKVKFKDQNNQEMQSINLVN